MKILLVGGGTLGSVNPLIALYEEAQREGKPWQWFWVGTRSGPERALVAELGLPYEWVPGAKLRRYFSFYSFLDPFLFIIAWLRSLLIMVTVRPQVAVSAGSFVAVPVLWAAACARVRVVIHQQDIKPGLANKLCAPIARRVTVSFAKSLADYPKNKTELIGNLVRSDISAGNKEEAIKLFNLDVDYPTVLILGGSSGALGLNAWVRGAVDKLTVLANIIHVTGAGKEVNLDGGPRYIAKEFLSAELMPALAAADLVITRAGVATLSELSYLGKAVIIVPMPNTHQEDNAYYFADQHAAYVYRQDQLDERVIDKIKELLASPAARAELAERIGAIMKKDGRERMVNIIEEISR